jgi:ATP-dependent Lon protease
MEKSERRDLPVIPLREEVLFPGPPVAVTIGRAPVLRALEAATRAGSDLFVVAQREDVESPLPEQLYRVGVVARIGPMQPGIGSVQVLLTGLERAAVLDYRLVDGIQRAVVSTTPSHRPLDENDAAFIALHREVRERAVELGRLRAVPEEVLRQVLSVVTDAGQMADLVAAYLEIPTGEKQALLETFGVEERLRSVLGALQRQLELAKTQQDIRSQVQEELGGRQRELYLREQLRAIRKELGEGDRNDGEELRRKIDGMNLPREARAEVERELTRLERAGPDSTEAQVIRTYLQWITELPWNSLTEDRLDLAHAERILDEDHYGLSDVKDRILEFLSVRALRARNLGAEAAVPVVPPEDGAAPTANEAKNHTKTARAIATGPILLFVGPPGVGKTSIAQSIARALDRRYVRVSLGGARDEADIRGHRRTYVGAMPGRIIQGMKNAGAQNPVFLLDEIDKLGVSFQGDPASALLEVLDPAQNDSFTDHYLNVPFDLSQVLFITTANVTHTIPAALLDRMEVVEFAGYTEREKAEIARKYLVPRQLSQALLAGSVQFSDEALAALVSRYTRESGVRQLEREIAAVTRKLARRAARDEAVPAIVTPELVQELLGRPRVRPEQAGELDEVGVATGMYYSPAGGDIMFVEAAVRALRHERTGGSDNDGPGGVFLILTGQLGDVMKESARAALTYVTAHAPELSIDGEWLGPVEVHVHVPAGAVPKDGPSAGVTIATALASAFSGRRVRRDVAMSGEVTLRGRVLPIGGVKEKVLGAHRARIHRIILPADNRPDVEDVPAEVRQELEFRWVRTLTEVFALALLPSAPTADGDGASVASEKPAAGTWV